MHQIKEPLLQNSQQFKKINQDEAAMFDIEFMKKFNQFNQNRVS